MKKRAKLIYLAGVMIVLIGALTQVDYSDLSWDNNAGMYLTVIAMLLASFGTIYTIFFEKD